MATENDADDHTTIHKTRSDKLEVVSKKLQIPMETSGGFFIKNKKNALLLVVDQNKRILLLEILVQDHVFNELVVHTSSQCQTHVFIHAEIVWVSGVQTATPQCQTSSIISATF